MKNKIVLLFFVCFALGAGAQSLEVSHYNDNGDLDHTSYYKVGDVVVLAHQKEGKRVHYFMGKVTGIYKDREVIRVFDYARSERAVSIVGKKIEVQEIVGIERLNSGEYNRREGEAFAATAMTTLGAVIGGNTGMGISAGSSLAGIGLDIATRKRVEQQHVKCQILE